jgi:hypothetical protein
MLYPEEFLTSEDLLSLSRINLFMSPQVFMITAAGESANIVTITRDMRPNPKDLTWVNKGA